jgi:small subunit ribosomal protein S6
MAVYESIFVLSTKTEEETEKKVVSEIRAQYEKAQCKLIKELLWGKRALAYPVKKEKEGIFYYFLWESNKGNVVEVLQNKARVTDSIIRSFHIRIDEDLQRLKKRYISGRETNICGVIKNDGAERKDIDITELIYPEPTAVFLREEY